MPAGGVTFPVTIMSGYSPSAVRFLRLEIQLDRRKAGHFSGLVKMHRNEGSVASRRELEFWSNLDIEEAGS